MTRSCRVGATLLNLLLVQQAPQGGGRGAKLALYLRQRPRLATAADRAKVAADVRRFAGVPDVTGKLVGPIPAKDGQALQVVVPVKVNAEATAGSSCAPGSSSCA